MHALLDWLTTLDPAFAFLLAMPFLVAAGAFAGTALRALRQRSSAKRQHTRRVPIDTRYKRRALEL